jgi:hypothetical protein
MSMGGRASEHTNASALFPARGQAQFLNGAASARELFVEFEPRSFKLAIQTFETTGSGSQIGTYSVEFNPVVEGSTATITITRTSGTFNDRVNWATALGSGPGAASASDFDAASSWFELGLNESTKITIDTNTDSLAEGTEFFWVNFTDAAGRTVGLKLSVKQEITDPANLPPDAVNDSFTATEDTPLQLSTSQLTVNDTDPNGDARTVTSVQGATNGTVSLVNGTVTFTPAANYHGPASFTYTISDGKGGTDTATVSITVNAVNDAPTGAATATLAGGTEDTAYTVSASELLEGFSDVDGDQLSVADLTATNATVKANANGTYTITPAANYNGSVTLDYNVVDGNGGSVEGSRSFTLAAVNDAPTANADSFGTGISKVYEGMEYVINVTDLLSNDRDVDGDTFQFVGKGSEPTKGTVSVVQDAGSTFFVYTYTGAALAENVTTADSFTYTIKDVQGLSAAGTVNLTVTGLANKMVNGTNQIDTLNGGNTSHDTIAGLNADDTIFGHGGNDKLFGGNGVDRLFGGDGADVLEGGNGDDRLDGGKGADILTGGLGADTFVFDRVDAAIANTGVDKITDFKVGTDDIWLGPGITVTNMTTAHVDANGHLDTILQLSNGGAIQVMDVSGLTHDQWLIIA